MKPFQDYDLGTVIGNQREAIRKRIDELSNEVVLGNDIEVIVENLYQEYFIAPVVIGEEDFERRQIKQGKIRRYIDPVFRHFEGKEYVYVDGVIATFFFPYSGETDLFKCRASVYTLGGHPDIQIEDGYVSFRIEKTLDEMKGEKSKELLINELNRNVKDIRDSIGYANSNVNAFNSSLRKEAKELLLRKKEKVESFFAIASMLEVPIEKKEFAKTHIPLQRKIVPLSQHYESENYYGISDKEYEDILDAIKHTCSTYERTPSSYKSLKEEQLRDILLAALNATYKGNATGEAFRNKGKTDINIECDNRAAFVAECKVWSGVKEIEEAVQQLDSYLTWRDCKTAIIYFVRRKDFLSILDKADMALKEIDGIKSVTIVDRNIYKCQYYSKSNPGQIVRIRVMLFNLYSD